MAAERSWAEIVAKADGPTRHTDELYPEIYRFGSRTFRRGSDLYAANPRHWSADSFNVTADAAVYTADALGAS